MVAVGITVAVALARAAVEFLAPAFAAAGAPAQPSAASEHSAPRGPSEGDKPPSWLVEAEAQVGMTTPTKAPPPAQSPQATEATAATADATAPPAAAPSPAAAAPTTTHEGAPGAASPGSISLHQAIQHAQAAQEAP